MKNKNSSNFKTPQNGPKKKTSPSFQTRVSSKVHSLSRHSLLWKMNVHLIHIKAYHLNNHILLGYICLTPQWHWCLNYKSWPRRKGIKLSVVLNASMNLPRTEGSSMQTIEGPYSAPRTTTTVNQNETIENAYICDSRNRRGQKSHSAQQFVYPWCTSLQALKPLVLVPTFSTNKMSLPSSNNTSRVCEFTNWISYYRASLSFLQCLVEVVIQQSIVCITTFCQDAYSFLLLLSVY